MAGDNPRSNNRSVHADRGFNDHSALNPSGSSIRRVFKWRPGNQIPLQGGSGCTNTQSPRRRGRRWGRRKKKVIRGRLSSLALIRSPRFERLIEPFVGKSRETLLLRFIGSQSRLFTEQQVLVGHCVFIERIERECFVQVLQSLLYE